MYDIYTLTQMQLHALLCQAFISGTEGCYDLMESEVNRIKHIAEPFISPKKLKQRRTPIRLVETNDFIDLSNMVSQEKLPISCPACEVSDVLLIRHQNENGCVYDKVQCGNCNWQASASVGTMSEKLRKVNHRKNG